MNNLLLSATLLTSALVLFLVQQVWRQEVQAANRGLVHTLHAQQSAIAGAQEDLRGAQERLRESQAQIEAARSNLAHATRELAVATTAAFNPAIEGSWPASRPYFYLPKKYLAQIGYAAFTPQARVSDEGAVLFGMTPSERAAVDAAAGSFMKEFLQLEASQAERLTPPDGSTNSPHREISFRMPRLNEQLIPLRAEYENALLAAVGPSRAELFGARAAEQFEANLNRFGFQPGILTFVMDTNPDGSTRYQIRAEPETGGVTLTTGIPSPDEANSAFGRYRHLLTPADGIPAGK